MKNHKKKEKLQQGLNDAKNQMALVHAERTLLDSERSQIEAEKIQIEAERTLLNLKIAQIKRDED